MKKKVRKNFIFIILLIKGIFFSSYILRALDPKYELNQFKCDVWREEHGLNQKWIVSIVQDEEGYILLGTLNGLIRFDGFQFSLLNNDNDFPLQDNVIRTLLRDKSGNLWIGTKRGGLTCFNEGAVRNFSTANFPKLENILTIFEDSEDVLWIGTYNNGLICLKDGIFTNYTTLHGLTANRVYAIHEDRHGNLWIGTSAGLSVRNKFGQISKYKGENGEINKHILAIYGAKDETLWLGCLGGLFYLKSGRINKFNQIGVYTKIMCFCEDSDNNLWIGTDGNGLGRLKKGNIEFLPESSELYTSSIYTVFEDREKNLWIGTLKKGLFLMRNPKVRLFTTFEGLSDNIVKCVINTKSNNLLIGTRVGIDKLEDEKITPYLVINKEMSNGYINVLQEGIDNTLWIGTEEGLFKYQNGNMIQVILPENITDKSVMQLALDKYNGLLILTPCALLRYYEEKFTALISQEGLSNNSLISFLLSQDTYWVGTYGDGLYKLTEKKITKITVKDGLANNEVESLFEDEKRTLYVGTRGGLSVISDDCIKNISLKDGLIDNYVYSILQDNNGNIWLSSRNGFARIQKKELLDFFDGKIKKITPVVFDETDGLKDTFCHYNLKTIDGKLWFATDYGLALFTPDSIEESIPPIVKIENIIYDGNKVNLFHSGIESDRVISIPPGTNRLEFTYTALEFVKSKKIKFKLKLKGFDDNWVDSGYKRSTSYTGLSPGIYTFEVKAKNYNSPWSLRSSSISVYIKPFFYQTTLFYLGVILFMTTITFFFYWTRVSSLKKRQKELTTLVDIRTEEIKDLEKARSRFFANISHEFRTPLTLLIGPLEQMISECSDAERKRKLTLMLRNAQRLLRLINQLLTLSKLDSGKMTLHAVKTDVTAFIKGIVDSFLLLAHQKELELVFLSECEENENIDVYIDQRKLEDILSNLLINAFKFTPAGGEVKLTIHRLKSDKNFKEGALEISISDTGPGIPVVELNYIFDRFYQADSTFEYHQKGSGIGLALSRELVELHHGKIEARNRESGGSEFTVLLPLGRSHLSKDEIVSSPIVDSGPYSTISIDHEDIHIMNENNQTFLRGPGAVFSKSALGERLNNENFSEEKNIILVVEDSEDMREYIRVALEPVYTLIEAKDGKEGVEMAREIIPDLIISDIMMPEMDGNKLCQTLKNDVQTSHIPIILLTAKASEDNIIEGLETGADDYITKPFSIKILMARIKNLIEIRSQLQQNVKREMTLQPVKTSVSKIDKEFLKELQKVLKENISEPDFNVEELCKKLYMSNTTLYRKIQALSGETPTEFLRSYRLKRAAQLLKSGSGSITEVAFDVGFSSRAYFTKCFKEKFNQLPSDFTSNNEEPF